MNPFVSVAARVVGGGASAVLLSLGLAGGLAQVAAAAPVPAPSTSAASPSTAGTHADRRAVRRAVLESEADLLGIKPDQLRSDLKQGQKVSDLARAKGMTEDQFAARLVVNLRPRLEQLVEQKVVTQARADRVIDRISRGQIPFWNGAHHR